MDIHEPDINKLAPTHGFPTLLDPCLGNKPIDENVKVGISVLLEFQNPDVSNRNSELPFNVKPPLSKRLVDVNNWVFRTYQFGIEGQSQESVQPLSFRQLTYCTLVSSCF